MARPTKGSVPSYRRHKQSGQGIVTLNYRDYLLGPYGTPEGLRRYHALIAKWLENGRRPLDPVTVIGKGFAPAPLTVGEMLDRHRDHAALYYRRADGAPTSEVANIAAAVAPVRELFGTIPAESFSPSRLKLVREAMIRRGHVRTAINRNLNRIIAAFKWAASEELVPVSVYDALTTVRELRRGRSKAAESEAIKPVDPFIIESIRPYLTRPVEALMDLQLLTGARPGEMLGLRAIDIDRTCEPWKYEPQQHKTAHRGRSRVILFGPRAREIITRFMVPGRDLSAPLFSPRDAHRDAATDGAKSSRRPDQKPNPKRTDRVIGKAYTLGSYRRAIVRACDAADAAAHDAAVKAGQVVAADARFVERFHPHQLRHSHGTEVRRRYGIEAAQVALGHASMAASEIYAERNEALAARIASEVG
ncbi:MAG: tyrosine-type recombinase/integrase [Tepidisphaeraceae bacterium]